MPDKNSDILRSYEPHMNYSNSFIGVGNENCTVWYNAFGEVLSLGPGNDRGAPRAVVLRVDEEGLLPVITGGVDPRGIAGLQDVLDSVSVYRQERSAMKK